jgi:hypothetical protein
MKDAYNGILASGLATSLCYPFDTIKTQLQSKQPVNWKVSYKGITPELIGAIPSSFLFWKTYSTMREEYKFTPFASSITAACVSNLVDTPFDILKKQRQLQVPTGLTRKMMTKFGCVNTLHSCAYNAVYMPLLNFLTNDQRWPRTPSIFVCCTTASCCTYAIDRWRTQIVYKQKLATWWKGLGYRILYGNIYSGLYMHIFLWLNQGKL